MSESDYYAKALADATTPVEAAAGASGYFSKPAPGLDPGLFDADGHLHWGVRQLILDALYHHWRRLYTGAKAWSTVWIAGSAASHQYAADRGNGDLDILVGIDWAAFYADNARYANLSITETAGLIDEELRTALWPRTAFTRIGDRAYEMTYYVNPLGTRIEDIGAYAAYNVTEDHWDIAPPDLPEDPRTLFNEDDWRAAGEDRYRATELRMAFDRALTAARVARVGTPRWSDAVADLRRAADAAAAFFDEIHQGRAAAFAPGGQGFLDPNNFRWQAAKQSGAVAELSQIKHFDTDLLRTVHPNTENADVLVFRALHHKSADR